MSDLTIFNNKNLVIPAYQANPKSKLDVSAGIQSGLPYIKLHGQSFVISEGGEKTNIGDSIAGVVIGAGGISKRCYLKTFDGVGGAAPDCASVDGIKPDEGIEKPIALKCADCEYNSWGSEITKLGKEAKKCKDYRRLAFCNQQKKEFKIYRFDIPPGSLGVLKLYGTMATAAGVPLDAIFTKVTFDPAKLNKLKFDAIQLMTLEQHEVYKKLTEDPRVIEILTQKTSSNVSDEVDSTPELQEEPVNNVVPIPEVNATDIVSANDIENLDTLLDIKPELDALTETL